MSDPAPLMSTTAAGARSIAVGGDAINSLLVTGDNNTFFVGRYVRLQDAYLNPALLYQELDLDRFVGREWLVAALDDAIARHDRGYIVLEAAAGMGKSTFLAWIARERGYVHHFVRLMPDPADIGTALRNLAAQLIRAWDLDTYAVGGILPPAADRPEFLREVLEAAAAQRDILRRGEPVVLAVDGLNETSPLAGRTPLGLPRTLPAGVYVLVSQRPVPVPLLVNVPREIIRIEPGGDQNQHDVHAYLEARTATASLREILDRDAVSAAQFVDALLAKSEGVWIYLHYVIAEIEAGRLSPAGVDRLPVGLWHYYAQYWRDWQHDHEDRWPELDLPVLAVLAAAAEPLAAQTIAELAATRRVSTVEELLDTSWRPFIQVDESGEEITYRPFHDSLKEFLRGSADVSELTTAERALARRLAQATKATHRSIADRYLNAWGGLPAGLPALAQSGYEHLDGGYGLRHLVDHLIAADRLAEVHQLMMLSRVDGGQRVNLWFTAHRSIGDIAGYRRSLDVMRNMLRTGSDPLRRAHQVRYVLIVCSLHSLAEATPPAVWSLLVHSGRLSPREAIAQAREIPAAPDRAEALTNLVPAMPADLREEVESEAMAAVRSVPDEFWRVGELCRLYPAVAPARRDELLAVVRSLSHRFYQVMALQVLGVEEGRWESLAPGENRGEVLSPDRPSELALTAEAIEDYPRRRQQALARLRQAGVRPLTRTTPRFRILRRSTGGLISWRAPPWSRPARQARERPSSAKSSATGVGPPPCGPRSPRGWPRCRTLAGGPPGSCPGNSPNRPIAWLS